MCAYIILIALMIAIARKRGLKNCFEAVVFASLLFILLMEVFQYL